MDPVLQEKYKDIHIQYSLFFIQERRKHNSEIHNVLNLFTDPSLTHETLATLAKNQPKSKLTILAVLLHHCLTNIFDTSADEKAVKMYLESIPKAYKQIFAIETLNPHIKAALSSLPKRRPEQLSSSQETKN